MAEQDYLEMQELEKRQENYIHAHPEIRDIILVIDKYHERAQNSKYCC